MAHMNKKKKAIQEQRGDTFHGFRPKVEPKFSHEKWEREKKKPIEKEGE